MTSRKKSFFEFWRSKKERWDLLERTRNLKLSPEQLKQLSDSRVRAELQNTRVASLLPDVDTEVFRRFTPGSLEEIERKRRPWSQKKDVPEGHPRKPTSDLETGKPLPFFYGTPPTELINTPLEDLDPFYQSQKTFMVISKNNIIHRFNANASCFLLGPCNPLRTIAIKILLHFLFWLLILLTVIVNIIFILTPTSPAIASYSEWVFVSIYIFEAIIKILSRGFGVGQLTYIRDSWNWLDIVIIITAIMCQFVDLGDINVIRILKIIPLIPGMRTTARNLFQPLKRTAEVTIIIVLFLSVFSIIGCLLFMGDLRNKCVMTYNTTHDYHDFINNLENQYFLPGQLDALVCGNSTSAGKCPEGYICIRAGRNPNYGYTSFDSFGWGFLSALRIMTLDFWWNLAQLIIRAAGKSAIVYFVMVLPASFYLLSLFVGMVVMATAERNEASAADAKQKEEDFDKILQALKKCEVEETDKKDSEHTALEVDRRLPSCCYAFADRLPKWNFCGCCRWLKQRSYALVMNPFFDLFIVINVIINIIFMAMEHYPMTYNLYMVLSYGELVFPLVYTIEMILKLAALGLSGYFKMCWNVFECSIVITALFLLIERDVEGLSPFGILQLLPVIRLAKWWPTFGMLLRIMRNSLGSLRNITLLLVAMVTFFSVAGMELFGSSYTRCVCRITEDCELPRWHMATLFHSILLIFRILCGEWIETLWDCMEVSGRAMCLIFYVVVLVIGKLLILSLFVGLLISNVAPSKGKGQEEGRNKLMTALNHIKKAGIWISGRICGNNTDETRNQTVTNEEDDKKEYLALTSVTSEQPQSEKVKEEKDDKQQDGNTLEDCCCDMCYQCCSSLQTHISPDAWRVWTNIRRSSLAIVENRFFKLCITIIILLSCLTLVAEDVHLDGRPTLKTVLTYADLVFTCVFVMEMILKMLGYGVKGYFTKNWSWLEFTIVNLSLFSLICNMLGVPLILDLKIVRSLRTVSRFKGTKVVLNALLCVLPATFDALLVCLTVWLIFAIMGVNLFAGKFYYCYNETSEMYFDHFSVSNKTECFELMEANFTDIRWKNVIVNFDHVAAAYLSLLQLATFSGWMDLMYAAVDSAKVEDQPVYESNVNIYLYFVVFFISWFFSMNLFIRVLIDSFSQLRHKFGGKNVFLTEEQKKLHKIKKKQLNEPLTAVQPPKNKCRAGVFRLVTSQCFEVFMVVVICVVVLNLLLYLYCWNFYSMTCEITSHWLDFTIKVIFLIESILKITALGRDYFKDTLNIWDFVLVLLSILDLFLDDFMFYYLMDIYSLLSIVRLARVFRALRLLPKAAGIRSLLWALVMSFPALFNIGLLLFFIMFSYAIIGMSLFPYVKHGAMLDDMVNFETFGNSMFSMFLISLVSGWDGLLLPNGATPPDCDPYFENAGTWISGNCGSWVISLSFFISYIIICLLLLVSVFFVIVMEIFDMFSEDNEEVLSDDNLQMFYNTWKRFDPDASQCIPYSKLSEFCDALKDPLRIPKPNTIRLIHMDLPLLPGDKIHYLDILLAIKTKVFGDSESVDHLKANMKEKFKAENTSEVSYKPISSTLRRKKEEVAASAIQKAYRKWRLGRKDGTEEQSSQLNGGIKEMETETEPTTNGHMRT